MKNYILISMVAFIMFAISCKKETITDNNLSIDKLNEADALNYLKGSWVILGINKKYDFTTSYEFERNAGFEINNILKFDNSNQISIGKIDYLYNESDLFNFYKQNEFDIIFENYLNPYFNLNMKKFNEFTLLPNENTNPYIQDYIDKIILKINNSTTTSIEGEVVFITKDSTISNMPLSIVLKKAGNIK